MDISYHEQEFDNAFKKPTIYRMDPSPEVDAAWDNLGFTCMPLELHPSLTCTLTNYSPRGERDVYPGAMGRR